MTAPAGPPASSLMPGTDGPVWHALSADRILQAEAVDGQRGLSSVEVVSRTERFGPNTFDTAKVESRWRAFVRQYADPMQVVLLVAGIVSLFLKEFETGVVLILLTLFKGVSLSIIVVSEIRKAVRRRTTAEAIPAGRFLPSPEAAAS